MEPPITLNVRRVRVHCTLHIVPHTLYPTNTVPTCLLWHVKQLQVLLQIERVDSLSNLTSKNVPYRWSVRFRSRQWEVAMVVESLWPPSEETLTTTIALWRRASSAMYTGRLLSAWLSKCDMVVEMWHGCRNVTWLSKCDMVVEMWHYDGIKVVIAMFLSV